MSEAINSARRASRRRQVYTEIRRQDSEPSNERPGWINAAAWSLLTDTFSDPDDTQRMAEQFAACIERHWRAAQ